VRKQNCSFLQTFGLSVGSCGFVPIKIGMLQCGWAFLASFFAGGRKKQNKFPSNLHCPIKKLNSFLFILSISYLSAMSVFTLVANVLRYEKLPIAGDFLSSYTKVESGYNPYITYLTGNFLYRVLPAAVFCFLIPYSNSYFKPSIGFTVGKSLRNLVKFLFVVGSFINPECD